MADLTKFEQPPECPAADEGLNGSDAPNGNQSCDLEDIDEDEVECPQPKLEAMNQPKSGATLRDAALASAQDVLSTEMRMLNDDQLREIAEIVGASTSGCTAQDLLEPFAHHYTELLLHPRGGCVLDLKDGMDPVHMSTKLSLFWRCAVMLHTMPLAALHNITPKHHNLTAESLPPKDAPEREQREALVSLNLPWFAQVAKTPGQVRDEQERERERKRKEQEKKEQEATASRKATAKPDTEAPQSAGEKRTAAAHTYDKGYQKWEQFDVEKALQEEDESWQESTLHATKTVEKVTKEDAEEAELDADLKSRMGDLQSVYTGKIREAHRLKEQGNLRMAGAQPEAAVQAYLSALDCVENIKENPLISKDLQFTVDQLLLPLYNNMALARLKLRQWDDAVDAASKALQIDECSSKALYRRGQAHSQRGDWEKAEADLESAVALEPADLSVQRALKDVQQRRAS
uniref:Uncharacterized protein n=1 Tax=Eutreptiella gymnastica TaxID=73025 RepID=A0A6T2EH09_9EUGL